MAGVDTERIERAVLEILLAIGEDPTRPGLERTPQRVAEAYADFFGGLDVDPLSHLADTVPLGATDAGVPATSDAVVLRDLAFRSVCEHHLLPFVGTAHVAYLPADRVVGPGPHPGRHRHARRAAAAAGAARRGDRRRPRGGARAEGRARRARRPAPCVTTRGSRQERSSTVTIASRGALAEPAARAEIIALIGAAERG